MKFCFLIVGISFQIFFIGIALTHAQQVSSDTVEIIADGERYGSIRAYRRQQIKDILTNALSVDNLQMFTEEELCEMIKEVRSQQNTDTPSKKPGNSTDIKPDIQQQDQEIIEENALDLSSSELQEMLDGYFKAHVETDQSLLNSSKIKSIIIEPEAESEAIYSD